MGYKGSQVKAYFHGKGYKSRIEIVEDKGFESDSTSRSLSLVAPSLNNDFIYSHREILYDRSLIKTIIDKDLSEDSAIIAVAPNTKIAPSHPRVKLSDKVDDIFLYPAGEVEGYQFSYMGVAKLSPVIFDYTTRERRVSDALKAMLNEKKGIGYVLYSGHWKHIGTREDLIDLEAE